MYVHVLAVDWLDVFNVTKYMYMYNLHHCIIIITDMYTNPNMYIALFDIHWNLC